MCSRFYEFRSITFPYFISQITGFWWGNLRERDHWGDPDVDGTIVLRRIFRKKEGVVGTG
jgi:hypothetical protein